MPLANFNTLDIPGDTTVTLDGSFTVGSLIFGDTAQALYPGPANNWILSPGSPNSSTLTLDVSSGTPTINVVNPTAQPINSAGLPVAETYYKTFVDQTATINSILAGNKGLTKTGYGTLALTAANTYTGTTSVANGTLTLNFSAAMPSNILASGSSLGLGGGLIAAGNGVLNLNGVSGATNSQSVAGTTLDFGNNAIVVNQNDAASVSLSLGNFSRVNHGVVNFTLPTTGSISATNASIPNSNGILGGWATIGVGANANFAANDGTGKIVPFTGYTVLSGDTPAIVSNPASNVKMDATSTGNPSVGAGVTDINSLIETEVYAGTANLRTVTIATGGTLRMGAQGGIFRTDNIGNQSQLLLTIGSGSGTFLTAGGANNTAGELIFNANNNPINADQNGIVVNATITDNGTGVVSLVQSGVSTTQLNFVNSYSGGTYINSGRVRGQTVGAFGTGPIYTAPGTQAYFNQAGTWTNDLYLSGMGYWETGGFTSGNTRLATNGVILAGTVTLMGDSMIDTRGATNTGATIAGKITGGFSPYFTGSQLSGANPGTIILTNSANDYAGDTIVLAGRLMVGGTGEVIPDGPGKGNLVMVGEGYLTAGTGTNTYLNLNGLTETINGIVSNQGFQGNPSDPTRIFVENSASNSTGTLIIGNNNATSNFAGTIRDANTATEGAAYPVPTNAFVAIGKIGSGTLTLSGNNTYSGSTTISNGTLALSTAGNNNIPNSNITVALGAQLNLTGVSGVGGFIVGPTQTLTNNGTVVGGVTVSNAGSTVNGTGSYPNGIVLQSGTVSGGNSTTARHTFYHHAHGQWRNLALQIQWCSC